MGFVSSGGNIAMATALPPTHNNFCIVFVVCVLLIITFVTRMLFYCISAYVRVYLLAATSAVAPLRAFLSALFSEYTRRSRR